MSKGASEIAETAPAFSVKTQTPVPVQSPPVKTITPLSGAGVAPKNSRPQQRQVSEKFRQEPPSQIKMANPNIKKILEEKFGENEMPLEKPPSQMRASELSARNQRITMRQALRKAQTTNKLPTPNPDQEAAIMAQHQMSRNESLQQQGASPLTMALSKVLSSKANLTTEE